MMNHSCEPNVAIVSEGNRVYIRSVRSIAAGEEITYPYIDPTSPKWVRQSELQKRLFFTCACTYNHEYNPSTKLLILTFCSGSKCTSESDANETTISGYSKETLDKLSEINSTMDYLKPDEAEQQQLTSLLGDAKTWPSADTYPMASIYGPARRQFQLQARIPQGDTLYATRIAVSLIQLPTPTNDNILFASATSFNSL